MAKKKDTKSGATSDLLNTSTSTFAKGLFKDYDDTYFPEGAWSHARNAVNNSSDGNVGVLGNEPSNTLCAPSGATTTAPYTIMGAIHTYDDKWAIFSADDAGACEIGLFDESECSYYKIVNDGCLKFKTTNLIIGQSKKNYDCTWQLYWDDGINPSRTLNIGDITLGPYADPWPGVPYVTTDILPGECENCIPITPLTLDCERLRIAKIIKTPSITLNKSLSGGTLLNGSYFAAVAYVLNGQRVTDYFQPSNVQALFTHDNISGGLQLVINEIENDIFAEFELVIVKTINQQTVAKRIGIYSTTSRTVEVPEIPDALVDVPIQYLNVKNPAIEKSEGMFAVSDYLVRVAPSSRYDFNYQPLANRITAKWVVTEYPSDYYFKGGNQTGYMRDEIYSFFIRWVYNTGDTSSSYHIPGRPAASWESGPSPVNADNFDLNTRLWETYNTAYITNPTVSVTQPDGGVIVGKGRMGYWESTEQYPANNSAVWNASSIPPIDTTGLYTTNTSDYELCGKQIRHHKMPADIINYLSTGAPAQNINYSHIKNASTGEPISIRLVGVEFENILPPVYQNETGAWVPIPGVVGYEILRGSRQGNKTVIAKGIINNMRYYYRNNFNEKVLYQNYPYNPLYDNASTQLQAYPDLAESDLKGGPSDDYPYPTGWYMKDIFTFHSFDTQVISSYLANQELVVYGERGRANNVRGSFSAVPNHPKHKLLTDAAYIIAIVLGLAEAMTKVRGVKTQSNNSPRELHLGIMGGASPLNAGLGTPIVFANGSSTFLPIITAPASVAEFGAIGTSNKITAAQWTNASLLEIGANNAGLLNYFAGGSPDLQAWSNAIRTSAIANPSKIGYGQDLSLAMSGYNMLPESISTIGSVTSSLSYWAQGITTVVNLFTDITKYRQYAMRYLSHGDLSSMRIGNSVFGNMRRKITRSFYLENLLQFFPSSQTGQIQYDVNNLYRGRCVMLQTGSNINNPLLQDNSLHTIQSAANAGYIIMPGPGDSDEKDNLVAQPFDTTATSYYVGLKIKRPNLYGQLDSIVQITTNNRVLVKPIADGLDTCNNSNLTTITSSDIGKPVIGTVVYGGDTYVGRYTEKNTFFYFRDWLYGQPDGTQFDYRTEYMILYPRYWATFTDFDGGSMMRSVSGSIASFIFNWNSAPFDEWDIPSNLHHLNRNGIVNDILGLFQISVRHAYMYLFQSGVRDFFQESEYNLDLRDWGNNDDQRFYDPYRFTDLNTLFDPRIIKAGNYFKYDQSLGVTKIYKEQVSWGNIQPRSYNPETAETCFTYYPNRLIYSLPQNLEAQRDFWQAFLAFNYKDFNSKVMSIRSYDQSGVMIFFNRNYPLMTRTVENLQLDLGTKITIGDGSLFSQAFQSMSNADPSYQYASTQDTFSVINSPLGIYYISQNQGKIFNIDKGLDEISNGGLKWWLAKYLPFKLLEDFPNFDVLSNTVAGIGCATAYDNKNQIVYFSKRDYKLKPDAPYTLAYSGTGYNFRNSIGQVIKLGDPLYFENASWTLSYDPKIKGFISFHDWHPGLMMGSKNSVLTTKDGGIWKHNLSTSSFCNFYGVDYPFEIEEVATTGQTVMSIKSMEYILEAYVYSPDGYDKFHVLDYNFNKAIVYNSEQVSGELRLNLSPKNNPANIVNYPIINTSSIDILYSKVENKYRFNQFWDITRDRGEYTGFVTQMWDTQANGYISLLNPNNLNYNKDPFQRKKFRHYVNRLRLVRENLLGKNDVKMLYKIQNIKQTISPR